MGTKKRITKDNYQEIVLRRSIIACWVILGICFFIKIFGGNFFEIVCTNDKFVSICNFIDKSWIAYLLRCISFLFSSFLIFKCIDYGSSKIKTIIFLILCMCVWSYKHLINLGVINVGTLLYNVLDFVSLYIISVICSSKKNIYSRFIKPLIFIALLFVFSIISATTKNIGIHESLNSYFVEGIIFMIDYYIMIVLTYLYAKRRYLRWVNGDGSLG